MFSNPGFHTTFEGRLACKVMAFAHTNLLPGLLFLGLFWLPVKPQMIFWFCHVHVEVKVPVSLLFTTLFFLRTVSSNIPFLPLISWVHLPPSTQVHQPLGNSISFANLGPSQKPTSFRKPAKPWWDECVSSKSQLSSYFFQQYSYLVY